MLVSGIDQRRAAAIDEPESSPSSRRCRARRRDCRLRDDDAILLGGDDGRRLVQAVGLDDQRAREERLDDGWRDARDRASRGRFGAHTRGELDGVASESASSRRVRAVEHIDVARVDPVRILDLVLVHVPELGPAPGRIGIALRDSPERVARDDDVAIRGVRLDRERASWAPAPRPRRDSPGEDKSERCDRLTQLVDAWAPDRWLTSRAGLKFGLLPKCSINPDCLSSA